MTTNVYLEKQKCDSVYQIGSKGDGHVFLNYFPDVDRDLAHVEQAIQAAGSTPDLDTLKKDLEELIKLTEDSLLSLRKSKLLKELDGDTDVKPETSSQSKSTANNSLDDEYAAFQAMLCGESDEANTDDVDGENTHRICTNDSASVLEERTSSSKGDNLDNESDYTQSVSDIYKDVIGTKCRAPFVQEWGAKSFSNALIASLECNSDLEIPKVRVMFCNPTHLSMLPCKYYLNGSCRFSEDDCRFSHGEVVNLEDLQEYKDPDFSSLRLESRCLARFDDDDLWYKATIVDLHDNHVMVTFDTYNDEPVTVPYKDILPLDESDQASSDSDDDYQPMRKEDSDEEDDLPVFLWKPPSHGLGDLGQWEAHTKGIGSRLLTKMGYVPGQGLGKSGEGRVQPVPIQLLPQGKSLDKIMLLKEKAGDRDMFDAMKKQEKKMKKHVEKLEQQYLKSEAKPDVFDFINKKLHGKKGNLSELIHKHEDHSGTGSGHGRKHQTISERDLKSKSDRSINIQLLKTEEEMKSVQKQIIKLKESLSRNENRDRNMAAQVRHKLQSLETYLEKLKSSESTMQSHQQKRSDHKKLTVF